MMEVAALVYAAQADADRGALEEAAARLDRADRLTEGKGKLLRSIMAGEAAWLAALRGEASRGRALLAEADGPFTERHCLRRAEAAVLLAEGDGAGARAAAEAGLAALPKARFGRPSERERELLEGLREAAS
jgi:predicted negative regulator of RcsB-dependent stress response